MTADVDGLRSAVEQSLRRHSPTPWLPDPANTTVTLLVDGIYHANFLVYSGGQVHVARVSRRSQWGLSTIAQLQREFAVLVDLAPLDVAPRPLALVDSPGAVPMIVESFLGGDFLPYPAGLSHCAETLATVHQCVPRRSGPLLDSRPAKEFLLGEAEKLLDSTVPDTSATRVLRRCAGVLEQRGLPETVPVLLHTDLIQHNIVLAADRCRFLDWEGARRGSAAWDLAYLLSPITLRWADSWGVEEFGDEQSVIRAYSSHAGLDAATLTDHVAAFMPFVVLRAAAWCVRRSVSLTRSGDAVTDRLALFSSPEFLLAHFRDLGVSV